MPIVSNEKKVQLTSSFTEIKKKATSVEDICRWFKKNPEIIPGLAPDLYKKIQVSYYSEDEFNFDYKFNTIYDICRFEFSIPSINEQAEKAVFTEITGLSLGKNENRSDFFNATYSIRLDSLEWRYVALSSLTQLLEEDLASPIKVLVLKNILLTNYPHQNWENFVALWRADLLPDDIDELNAVLEQSANINVPPSTIPNDISI